MASMGSWGQVPGNCNRDLKRAYPCDDLPLPTTVRVPCLSEKAHPTIVVHTDVGLMLPHLWIASIATSHLADQLLGLQSVEQFWASVNQHDPRLQARGGHPVLSVPNYNSSVVPLWLHGDGVEYAEDESLMTLTFGSVLATTNSMDSMFWMASFVKAVTATQTKHGADTWDSIWKVLVWSFKALWLGTHPTKDWNDEDFEVGSLFLQKAGQPLYKKSGSSFGICWGIGNTLQTTCICHIGKVIKCVGFVTATRWTKQKTGKFAGQAKGGPTGTLSLGNTHPLIPCSVCQGLLPGVFVQICCIRSKERE